jgi:hypothetical protein
MHEIAERFGAEGLGLSIESKLHKKNTIKYGLGVE